MSALDHVRTRPTMLRKPIHGELEVDARTRPTGDKTGHLMSDALEYETTLTVGVKFWANRAEYEQAEKQSEVLLLRTLHKDVLHATALIRSAVIGRDQDAALLACDELEKALGL